MRVVNAPGCSRSRNTVGSSIARESDATFYTRGGPEVAVASTKAVMAQLVAMYLVGLYLAQVRGYRDDDEIARTHGPGVDP